MTRRITHLLSIVILLLFVACYAFQEEISTFSHLSVDSLHSIDSVIDGRFVILKEVKEALERGDAVVALESTVISHGMPFPENLKTGKELEEIVRKNGAIPATIALMNGKILVGLNESSILELAQLGHAAHKTSRRDLSFVLASKRVGATTVSATSWVASKVGIRVFATGGIGGVHRYGETTMDISADLTELGRTPIAVVCAGAKSILDIERTLEFLETQGVPVIGYNTTEFPAFFTRKSGHEASASVKNARECAELIEAQSELKLEGGIVIAVPVPEEEEAESQIVEDATLQALQESKAKNVKGKEATPFLLQRIAELTKGVSLKVNIALIKNNAIKASEIARELSNLKKEKNQNSGPKENRREEIVVVGGMVLDIVSRSSEKTLFATSNPGKIVYRPGGVGRNVLEGILRLGKDAFFISSTGKDNESERLLSQLQSIRKTSVEGILYSDKDATAVYNAVLDPHGEMIVAIADMDIFEALSPEHVLKYSSAISNAKLVVVDANVPQSTLEIVLKIGKGKVVFEPTSVPKSYKIATSERLRDLHTMTPNIDELSAVAQVLKPNTKYENSTEGYAQMIDVLLEAGVHNVLLKMGANGVLYGSQKEIQGCNSKRLTSSENHFIFLEALKTEEIINVTGAGDSLVSAFVWGQSNGETVCQSLNYGLKAAKLSLESDNAVSPKLSANSIK